MINNTRQTVFSLFTPPPARGGGRGQRVVTMRSARPATWEVSSIVSRSGRAGPTDVKSDSRRADLPPRLAIARGSAASKSQHRIPPPQRRDRDREHGGHRERKTKRRGVIDQLAILLPPARVEASAQRQASSECLVERAAFQTLVVHLDDPAPILNLIVRELKAR